MAMDGDAAAPDAEALVPPADDGDGARAGAGAADDTAAAGADGEGKSKKELKAAEKAAKAAEKEAAKLAKAEEKEAAKLAKAEEKAAKKAAKAGGDDDDATPDAEAPGGDAKAAKAAEKEAAKLAKAEEKEAAKLAKAEEKAAKKAAKKGVVEMVGDAGGGAGWTDGVDEESTPEGGSAGVSPVDSPVVVTAGGSLDALASGVWKGGDAAVQELLMFNAPVDAIRACAVQRKDKKCIVLIDRDNGDAFLACARLCQKLKKDKCWRFYLSPQAVGCKAQDLTKDPRLGYFGKLEFQDPTVNPKVTLQLYDHAPGEGQTDKKEVLTMTLKKKKKHAQWKVRAANAAGVIYRSQVPEFDKARKQNVYAGMSLNPQESVKNFLLCRENAGVGSPTGSTAGVEMSNNAAAAKAAKDAAMRAIQATMAIELGKKQDDLWDMRVKPPFSLYQAFGMAVASIYAT